MTTDNRTNEPTPEQVEAAARALWAFHGLNGEWDAGTHEAHENCREDARNALVAAAGAAPVQPSSTVDEGKIAEVVRGLSFNDAGCWTGGIDCTESVSDHADVIARAVVEAIGGKGA